MWFPRRRTNSASIERAAIISKCDSGFARCPNGRSNCSSDGTSDHPSASPAATWHAAARDSMTFGEARTSSRAVTEEFPPDESSSRKPTTCPFIVAIRHPDHVANDVSRHYFKRLDSFTQRQHYETHRRRFDHSTGAKRCWECGHTGPGRRLCAARYRYSSHCFSWHSSLA